jgi:hypothetical protein
LPIDGAPLDGFPVTPGRTPAVASSRQRLLPLKASTAEMQLKPGVVQLGAAPVLEPPVTASVASSDPDAPPIALTIGAPISGIVTSDATIETAEGAASKGDAIVASEVVDASTGSRYRAVERAVNTAGERDWVLEHRSQGALLGVTPLSRTMDALWRRTDGNGVALPSATWTQLCAGQVWSAQDGYQLIVGARARGSLQTTWEGEIASPGEATVTHLSGMACVGSALTLQGYAFELGAHEPALTSGPTLVQRFTLSLDGRGTVLTRSQRTVRVSMSTLCLGAVAEERARFCVAWRRAVGP